jgi:hypothetical protein
MKYEIEGGGHVEAASPLELVEALRQDAMAWAPSVSVEDYMEDLAARSKIQDGSTVRTDSAENFITDLIACGFLTPVIPIILGTDDPQPAKNALLSALIQAAPADAQWFVSSDSWEEIPALLAFAQEPSDNAGEWKFRISEANRPHLREAIEQYELGEKNVHMTLLSATGSHLFHSFDGLLMIVVDRSLGITDDLRHRFPELEIDEE